MSEELLKKACDLYGQRGVARMIGKSPTAVNQILHGNYPNPQRILSIVAKQFNSLESDEYECPVLGTIHKDVCSKYQTWSEQNKTHKDRLYMQVKGYCKECKYKGVSDE